MGSIVGGSNVARAAKRTAIEVLISHGNGARYRKVSRGDIRVRSKRNGMSGGDGYVVSGYRYYAARPGGGGIPVAAACRGNRGLRLHGNAHHRHQGDQADIF